MEAVTALVVKAGRKTYTFNVPDQADDFSTGETTMNQLWIKNEGVIVMCFAAGKWDSILIRRGNGAVV